jgi:MFS family permease
MLERSVMTRTESFRSLIGSGVWDRQLNRRFSFTVVAGCLCGLLFGYDIGAMAGAAPDVRTCFGLSPAALGLAISSVLFGTIVGSITAGFLADVLGRRNTISASVFIYMLAVILAASAAGLIQFAACRFLCGIAIGLISVVAPMYLAEIAPSELRGRIVGSFQVNISVGVVTAFLASYLLSLHAHPGVAWRLSLAAGAIPALLCELCLMGSSVCPQSSGGPETFQAGPVTAMQKLSRPTLFSRQYLRPIALAVSIAVFNQLTGVNALLYYVLDIFKDLGSGQLNGRADAITLSALSLLVTLIAILVIDKIGRKPLLLTGAAGMSICLFLLPVIRHRGWPAYSVVIDIAIYNGCFGFSQGAVIWVYLSEIFPLPVRARGQSLGTTVHWITNAFVVGTFPAVASHWGGKVFWGLGFLLIIQFLIISWFYPETNGRTLESLASGFRA